MFEYADAAVEAAMGAGARYADARVMDRRHESMNARNGEVEGLTQEGSVGIGVRALIGSATARHGRLGVVRRRLMCAS
jgi:TldD protein